MKLIKMIGFFVSISMLLIYCGSGELSTGKAKSMIVDELDGIVDKIIDVLKPNLETSDIDNVKEKISQLKNSLQVVDIKKEDNFAVANIVLKIKSEKIESKVKFSKTEKGWQIEEFLLPGGNWVKKGELHNSLTYFITHEFNRGKIIATMGDMKTIGSAIESYLTDEFKAPEVNSIKELKEVLEPFYIKKLPITDAWGNNFHYLHKTGEEEDVYFIGSGGSDGKFSGFEQNDSNIDLKGNDIIYSCGEFVLSPGL